MTPPVMFLSPGTLAFSRMITFAPLRASVRAVAAPAGPAPTTMTSYSGTWGASGRHHCFRYHLRQEVIDVCNHRVVGYLEDWGVRVEVDCDYFLGFRHTHPVRESATYAERYVDCGAHRRPRLADLVVLRDYALEFFEFRVD